jgi:ABC-type uncharacterized transport system permease subunit
MDVYRMEYKIWFFFNEQHELIGTIFQLFSLQMTFRRISKATCSFKGWNVNPRKFSGHWVYTTL